MFVFNAAAGPFSTSASANTAEICLSVRQVTKGVSLTALWLTGKAAAATAITGIVFRVRRATTPSSGGTSVTLSPRYLGPTATSTAHDKTTALTAGTSTTTAIVVGCPSVGGGGWTARDEQSKLHLEAGSTDSIDILSETAGTTALSFEVDAEIEE